ncbi:MAG: putative molybdenum carrier protein [Desulfuromonadaceae bacterium]|nr:putative molybdenum carrier protein [Desulfuromonadaceae bacterium]
MNKHSQTGLLILNVGKHTGGTKLTEEYAKLHGKLHLVMPLDEQPKPETVTQWLEKNDILNINVGEQRESKYLKDIY